MITVRLATLADTAAIVEIYRSQRAGDSFDFDDLTLYERWQEAGPWVSIETCAVHLNRLLAGSGVPLVAELDGRVLAEAEVYEGFEPPPFGHHLHIGMLTVHADHGDHGGGTSGKGHDLAIALIKYIAEMARLMKCERVTVSGDDTPAYYQNQGFRQTRTGRGVRVATQLGKAFYQATDLTERSAEQVKGWFMPLGRYQSSRQEWDRLFPQDWAAGIPELLNVASAHLKLTVTGQNAIIYLREVDRPGEVAVACWSARPLTNPLLTAIRDRVYRDGYHTIFTYVLDADLLGNEAQPTSYSKDLLELPL